MPVSPEEEERILNKIREKTASAARIYRHAEEAAGERRDAVQEGMEAGIGREKIAAAAGVNRSGIYQILGKRKRKSR